MRIGLVGDTHGDPVGWERAIGALGELDIVLHAGDVLYHGIFNPITQSYDPRRLADMMNSYNVPVVHARGNCDSEVDQLALNNHILSDFAFAWCDGLKILVTHGHKYPKEDIVKLASRTGINVIHMGHTHMPVIESCDGVTVVNAGSCSLPKQPGEFPTAGYLEGGLIRILNLITGEIYLERKI